MTCLHLVVVDLEGVEDFSLGGDVGDGVHGAHVLLQLAAQLHVDGGGRT